MKGWRWVRKPNIKVIKFSKKFCYEEKNIDILGSYLIYCVISGIGNLEFALTLTVYVIGYNPVLMNPW